ncbi:MAG TPA: hypothetical protein VFQ44_02510 [Streptosporangiaceae bacterium]|nr:hypothetical protein [Streptosporangiaceae bacterium]
MAAPFEHANEVRDALSFIMTDPALGPGSLTNARAAANLLQDLLPDAPREMSLLLAAIAAKVPGTLQEHVANGMAGDIAVSLVAASLASKTAFTPEACQWVTAELAVALSLVPAMPAAQAAEIALHPSTEAHTEMPDSGVPGQEPTIGASASSGGPAVRTTVPEPVRPEPARPRRGPGRAKVAALALSILAVAAAGGAALYAAVPGRAAHHHRTAPGSRLSGTATVPATPVTPVTSGTPDNAWIAQLASVSHSAGEAALNSDLAHVRLDVPHARVLNTNAYASLRPGYWVIYYGHFATGTQALAYCAARNRTTRDLCIGRYLSNNPADFGYQCYPPAASPSGNCTHRPVLSPARVVEAYIAAINQRNWARVWALGGKNLGPTYHQMIAGYAHTSYVQVTSITADGPDVTVFTTATETNGTTQRYKLSYLVNGGTITAGQSTLLNP